MQSFTYDIEKGYTPSILSAVIGVDSFFYGLFDYSKRLYSCHYHEAVKYNDDYIAQISETLSKYKHLKQKVALTTKPFLHIPEREEDITKFYPAFDDKMTNSESFTGQDIKVLFGMKAEHLQFIESCFDNPTIHHLSKVISPKSKEDDLQPMVHAFVDESNLHLIAQEHNKLKYYNQFRCGNKNDFLYFTMMMYDLLGYDRFEVPLNISGRVDKSSEIYKSLYDYINHINFADTTGLQVVDVRYKDRKHYYYDLYRTAICES